MSHNFHHTIVIAHLTKRTYIISMQTSLIKGLRWFPYMYTMHRPRSFFESLLQIVNQIMKFFLLYFHSYRPNSFVLHYVYRVFRL